VTFEAPSDGTDGIEGERLSRNVTGDGSRFLVYYLRDLIWEAPRDELPQRIKRKIDTEKCLVSIFWLVNRIHSLRDVPKGTTYNTAFVTDAIMPV
jgi:hypothetical protein